MAFLTITHWNTTEWNDEMEATARDKFVPLILSAGATRVQMVRTGDKSFSVVTEYTDEKAAQAAQDKMAEIRSQAAETLPTTMESASGGTVYASS